LTNNSLLGYVRNFLAYPISLFANFLNARGDLDGDLVDDDGLGAVLEELLDSFCSKYVRN
jgi:hypothetical protein